MSKFRKWTQNTSARSEFRKIERRLTGSTGRPLGYGAKLSDLTQDRNLKLRDLVADDLIPREHDMSRLIQ